MFISCFTKGYFAHNETFFSLLVILSIGLLLFGCNTGTDKTDSTEQQKPVETTTAPTIVEVEEVPLPQDGYYVFSDSESGMVFYLQLQNMEGAIYMYNLPMNFSLEDKHIRIDGHNLQKYTYENEEITFAINGMKLSFQYVGTDLPEEYKPLMPPVGRYAVSSIGIAGDMEIYGTDTDNIMVLSEDGTGTFYFAEKEHQLTVQDGSIKVDGEPIRFNYYPQAGDGPMLLLLWMTEDADTIILRRVAE